MPRPRTPTAKAKLTGAAANHPERFKARSDPKSSGPVGDPPAFLSGNEKKAWRDFAGRWSWITADDEPALVALCQMRALIEDKNFEKNAAFYTAYRLAMSDFGGSPVSRSKVYQAEGEEDDDPFAKFGMQ